MRRALHCGFGFLAAVCALAAQSLPSVATELPPDLKTIETLTGVVSKGPAKLRPVLGIRFGAFRQGSAEIQTTDPGSPAAQAGLLPGDLVRQIGRFRVTDADDLERALAGLRVGEPVQLSVKRPGVRRDVVVELGESDRVGDPGWEVRRASGSFLVTGIRPGSGAAKAGMRVGDTFAKIDGILLSSTSAMKKLLEKKLKFTVHLQRPESLLNPALKPVGAKEEEVIDWRGKSFKLAVLLVEFADRKHHAKYASKDFERILFSRGEYALAPDGRKTYGSLRDYYQEMSVGTFDVTGKVFDWVQVPETWSYYDAQDMGGGEPGTRTVFQDALKLARDRFGADALDKFDGVVFLYAGERESLRGSQLWPHRSSVQVGGRHVPYYIIEEGGEKFASIGVHCHEFGHMLGLPDFYGYGHRTGVGEFCVMAIGHLGAPPSGPDRPFHMCAWCKIRMGWLTARTVLPNERQHVALRAVEGRTQEALKIPLTPTGDEYLLLEVRNRIGFDQDFFREGLLIWHVGDDGARERGQISVPIDLIEAHGKRYFDASLREESEIVFPNSRLDALTPSTYPSSKSRQAGGYELFLTDMRIFRPQNPQKDTKVPPGSVLFRIGDKGRAALVKSEEPEQPKYPEKDAVTELDPVTKLPVPFKVGKDGVAEPGPAIMPRDK